MLTHADHALAMCRCGQVTVAVSRVTPIRNYSLIVLGGERVPVNDLDTSAGTTFTISIRWFLIQIAYNIVKCC